MAKPSRRKLLKGLAVAGTAALMNRCLPWPGKPHGGAERFLLAVAKLIPIPDLLAVGRAFLTSFPEEANAEELLFNIFADLSFEPEHQPPFLDACQQQFRSEHENGDTVIADGWLISRSEARFCALIYLGRQGMSPR